MCTHVGETVEAISDAAMILGDPAPDEVNAIDSPVTKLEGIISVPDTTPTPSAASSKGSK